MTWTIFDYGVGNLHSLHKALQAAGAEVAVTADPDALRDTQVIVLPGVGAFGAVMERLAPAADVLRDHVAADRPLVGICIGMQVLYAASEEAPGVAGLGLLPGTVKRLDTAAGKVPHMGWDTLDVPPTVRDPIVAPGQHVYFVHSYAAPPGPYTVATTTYGTTFSAAERCNSITAFQFHPEKSSRVGAAILQRLVAAVEAT